MSTEYTDYGAAGAVYHDISPKAVFVTRVFGVLTVCMMVLSFVFCLVKGSDNSNLYLQAANIIISGFIAVVIAAWYRTGSLAADKFWFVILTCCVLLLQCLITDILAFNFPTNKIGHATTILPHPNTTGSTTTHHN